MLGVDKMDQLSTYYHFLHRSVKWWRKVFFWLLEVIIVNSYVMHCEISKKKKEKPMTHLRYRQTIISILSEGQITCSSSRQRSTPHRIERLRPTKHFLQKTKKRRDCVVCSDRNGTRHLTQYECQTCSNNPALCPTDCFKQYHTQRHYIWNCTHYKLLICYIMTLILTVIIIKSKISIPWLVVLNKLHQ